MYNSSTEGTQGGSDFERKKRSHSRSQTFQCSAKTPKKQQRKEYRRLQITAGQASRIHPNGKWGIITQVLETR